MFMMLQAELKADTDTCVTVIKAYEDWLSMVQQGGGAAERQLSQSRRAAELHGRDRRVAGTHLRSGGAASSHNASIKILGVLY